jgi:hypothetical protein
VQLRRACHAPAHAYATLVYTYSAPVAADSRLWKVHLQHQRSLQNKEPYMLFTTNRTLPSLAFSATLLQLPRHLFQRCNSTGSHVASPNNPALPAIDALTDSTVAQKQHPCAAASAAAVTGAALGMCVCHRGPKLVAKPCVTR